MGARWRHWLGLLRTGFWFVPLLMLFGAGALALLMLLLDERVDPGIHASLPWAYSGGPEGARSLLSTIAGSMITAASVTFSLASVALSIASQQYGSRVLRNFMRDHITQVLLGTFVSTFIYSVLVVRAIRGSAASGGFVPAISVTTAIVLAVVSLILLIYFIHHISTSIQASHIVRVIAEDMADAIPKLYPSETGDPSGQRPDTGTWTDRAHTTLAIRKSGYLQTIDLDSLLACATEDDLVIEVLVRPGDHLIAGQPAARILGREVLPESILKRLLAAFLAGGERSAEQDIRYQFQQLTDVIVRALSPGINDPFTAINGIDELTAGVALLVRRARIENRRQDKDGVLRLIVPTPGISEVLDATVGHIAIYGAGDHFVMAKLRRVLDVVERDLKGQAEQETLQKLRGELDRREQAEAV